MYGIVTVFRGAQRREKLVYTGCPQGSRQRGSWGGIRLHPEATRIKQSLRNFDAEKENYCLSKLDANGHQHLVNLECSWKNDIVRFQLQYESKATWQSVTRASDRKLLSLAWPC